MNQRISFRPLERLDFSLMHRWRNSPHVAEWWSGVPSLEELAAKYEPRIDGTEPTYVFVLQFDSRPIGWLQWYRWADYREHALEIGAEPEAAGLDPAIGEPDMIGRGVGPVAIRKFVDEFIFTDSAITAVVSDPVCANTRSVRAFQKAGFHIVRLVTPAGESCQEAVMRLNSPFHP